MAKELKPRPMSGKNIKGVLDFSYGNLRLVDKQNRTIVIDSKELVKLLRANNYVRGKDNYQKLEHLTLKV